MEEEIYPENIFFLSRQLSIDTLNSFNRAVLVGANRRYVQAPLATKGWMKKPKMKPIHTLAARLNRQDVLNSDP